MGAVVHKYLDAVFNYIKNVSGDTLEWLAVLSIHCAFIPGLLAVLMGVSDKLPSVDVVGFVWMGLILLFIRATITRNTVKILTIGLGFFIQAILLALIVFK